MGMGPGVPVHGHRHRHCACLPLLCAQLDAGSSQHTPVCVTSARASSKKVARTRRGVLLPAGTVPAAIKEGWIPLLLAPREYAIDAAQGCSAYCTLLAHPCRCPSHSGSSAHTHSWKHCLCARVLPCSKPWMLLLPRPMAWTWQLSAWMRCIWALKVRAWMDEWFVRDWVQWTWAQKMRASRDGWMDGWIVRA